MARREVSRRRFLATDEGRIVGGLESQRRAFESELERALDLDVSELADAIEAIGFECTRCGACCTSYETDDGPESHIATVFPDEVRRLQSAGDYDWRDVARPMPYGLLEGSNGVEGETLEWSLAIDDCGDCTFYDDDSTGVGTCRVHAARPLVCRTYPFSLDLDGTNQPLGEAVDRKGVVRAHECEGLGTDIDPEDARSIAFALKRRAIRELSEAIDLLDSYEPVRTDGIVVHDSEGAKRPNGRPISFDSR